MKTWLETPELSLRFLEPFGVHVVSHTAIGSKPLEVDLALPLPPRLRVYLYNLVGGGTNIRDKEYKAILRLRGQQQGQYASFDYSDGRSVLLVGYRDDLDVFVLWDASLCPRFKNGGNIQVRNTTVFQAAALGQAEQIRVHNNGDRELVLACQSSNLVEVIDKRLTMTGSLSEAECLAFPTLV